MCHLTEEFISVCYFWYESALKAVHALYHCNFHRTYAEAKSNLAHDTHLQGTMESDSVRVRAEEG